MAVVPSFYGLDLADYAFDGAAVFLSGFAPLIGVAAAMIVLPVVVYWLIGYFKRG